jgi:hypothetical protein
MVCNSTQPDIMYAVNIPAVTDVTHIDSIQTDHVIPEGLGKCWNQGEPKKQ